MPALIAFNSPFAEPRTRAKSAAAAASGFPWLFFVLTWLILFPYQNQLDPGEYDEIEISSVVGSAQTGNSAHQILAILLGTIGIATFFKYRKGLRLHGAVAGLLIAYVGWTLLSAMWSDDIGVTLRRQAALGLILAFSAGCAARMTKDTLALFVAGLAGLNLCVAVLLELFRGTLDPLSATHRFSGTVSPNTQGAALALGAIVAFWYAWRTRGSFRRNALFAGFVFLVFILMTGSRTTFLGLAASSLASFILVGIRKYKRQPVLLAALILLSLGSVATMALISAASPRTLELASFTKIFRTERDVGELTDLTGRNLIWDLCLRYSAERPVLGYGYGGFWTASRIDAVADELHWTVPHSHCAYLDVLLQTGIPGLALYVFLLLASLATCAVRFLKCDDACGAWFALFVFLTINGLTESIVVLPTFASVAMSLLWMKLAIGFTGKTGRQTIMGPPPIFSAHYAALSQQALSKTDALR